MPSSATLYSITITNSNTTSAPNDGFVDNLKIENYYAALNTTPADLTLELCQAKVRGNLRYRDIISQLGIVANCYVVEQAANAAVPTMPLTTSDATGTTEASSFAFKIIVEHGDASLVTADEYNAGSYLTGAACVQRCVGRALLNDMFRIVDVFDPTESMTTGWKGTTADIIRFGNRIMTDVTTTATPPLAGSNFEIGPYATSISNADGLVAVTKVTF